MNLREILEDTDVIIKCNRKWIAWDGRYFCVYGRPYKAKRVRCYYEGPDEDVAISSLLDENL